MTTDPQSMIEALKGKSNNDSRAKVLIEFLGRSGNSDQIAELCQVYKNYLLASVVDSKLPEASRIKALERHLTPPRKLVTSQLGEGHYSLKCLVLDSEEAAIRDTYNDDREDRKSDSTVAIDAKKILQIASELMASASNSAELAAGIQVVTGRRIIEVYLGNFEVVDSHTMIFNGQRKKRGNVDAATSNYLIPVLTDAQAIKDAHERLMLLYDVSKLLVKENPEKSFNSAAEYRKCNAICAEKLRLPSVAVRQKTHQSRSFYARCIEEIAKKQHSKAGTISKIVTKALGDLPGMADIYGHYEIKNLPDIDFQVTKKNVGIINGSSIKVIAEEFADMTINLGSVVEKMSDRKAAEQLQEALKEGSNPEQLLAQALTVFYRKVDETGKKKSGVEKLADILQAIINANKAVTDPLDRLEVTASVLSQIHKEVYGSDVPSSTSKKFLSDRENQKTIKTHYKASGIEPGHNVRNLRSTSGKISELVTAIASDMKMAESFQ